MYLFNIISVVVWPSSILSVNVESKTYLSMLSTYQMDRIRELGIFFRKKLGVMLFLNILWL